MRIMKPVVVLHLEALQHALNARGAAARAVARQIDPEQAERLLALFQAVSEVPVRA